MDVCSAMVVQAEYLYYDLGHVNLNKSSAYLEQLMVHEPSVSTLTSRASNKGSIARAGINYHFGAY